MKQILKRKMITNTSEKEIHNIDENSIPSNIPRNSNDAPILDANNAIIRENYTNIQNRNINAFNM